MIYIAVEPCENNRDSQHLAGISARNKLFKFFSIDENAVIKDENGKPQISGYNAGFSVSHSDSIAVCALKISEAADVPGDITVIFEDSASNKIGIDTEVIQKEENLARLKRIAERFLYPAGTEEINTAEDFARLWTRAEAYGKYTGRGLSEVKSQIPAQRQLYSFTLETDNKKFALSICI